MTQWIQHDSAVLVHFTLQLEDGTEAESSRANGKPALFRLGDGSLSRALEGELLGRKLGDKLNFTLEPLEAFGEKNQDLIQFFSLRDFNESGTPEVGAIIIFTAMDGSEMPGVVREIIGDSVTVDFNHPLAGRPITFAIEILEIDPAQGEHDANPTC